MKKSIVIILLGLFSGLSVFAQQAVPQGMKYQAVARNLGGELLSNRQVNLQISLLSMDADAQTFYSENQFATTNNLGLFELTIGQGKAIFGEFALVPWASEEIWIDFKLDENGTGDFKTVSTTRLLAVPYAFHAGTAGEISNGATGQAGTESCGAGSATGTLWSTNANCASSATAKLGTADLKPVRIVTNFIERILIDPAGKAFFRQDVKMDKDLEVVDQGTLARVLVENDASTDTEDFDDFPVRVDVDNAGMAIRVDGSDHNYTYASFWDGGGERGAITAQSFGDLYSDPFFIIENAVYAIELVYVALDITGLTTELATVELQVLTAAEGIGIGIQLAAITTKLVQLTAEYTAWLIEKNLAVGVEYGSGLADYAEWLEKTNPAEDFLPGQIVGVKGGKISLETRGADHVMVISLAPAVVGNTPPVSQKQNFEKVAFMGQVPVRVIGKVKMGDFILASGNADGYAVAVSPDKMKIQDYSRIVGVAWQSADNDLINSINVAVGINSNDMADRMAEQARQIETLTNQVNEIYAFLKGETKALGNGQPTVAVVEEPVAPMASTEKPLSVNPMLSDDYLEKVRPALESKMKETIAQLRANGVEWDRLPAESKAMLENPVQTIKDVQSGKHGQTVLNHVNQMRAAKSARSGK